MAVHRQPVVHAGTSSTSRPPVSAADADTYGSSSTLSAEAATGWHMLKVEDYSRKKELSATGWLVQSATFTVGRCFCSMRITCYPNGDPQDPANWICFKLYLEPSGCGASADPDDAIVRTRYSLLGQTGLPLRSSIRVDRVRTLSSMLGSWSCTPFMERDIFESSYYVKDNRFTVRCDVTVVRMTCRLSAVMPPDLSRHLEELLASGVGADVTLEVGGEAFPAHRSVLAARSAVFKAELFRGAHKEEAADATATMMTCVRIHDIQPSVFKALLHFIYTDSLPAIDDASDETTMARRLLVAAQRYQLAGLQWICEDVLGISCPRRATMQLPSLPDKMRAKVAGCQPFVTYSEHGWCG